jgi:lipoprotein-anchoring transpeptidase ErfK/SrfK
MELPRENPVQNHSIRQSTHEEIPIGAGLRCLHWILWAWAVAAQQAAIASEAVGTIIVRTAQRRLYLVTAPGRAISYPVGVGRAGKQWQGDSFIISKRIRPAWSPPAEMKRERPRLPDVIAAGSPSNPMGAAALVLAHGEYAIHGTNNPGSIGGFVSFGCIRMHNRDILDLFERVSVGTRVVVTH